MNKLTLILLLFCSFSFAKESEQVNDQVLTSVQILKLFESYNTLDVSTLPDLVAKEEKISVCVDSYIKKRLNSYSRVSRNNLYELIHDFGRVTSRIAGKKSSISKITEEEKVEALAKLQCEVYYNMGVLK